jgi:hypothetical protein
LPRITGVNSTPARGKLTLADLAGSSTSDTGRALYQFGRTRSGPDRPRSPSWKAGVRVVLYRNREEPFFAVQFLFQQHDWKCSCIVTEFGGLRQQTFG